MEIDNISNYINYKLHEHKTHLIIFINDDYETKKLKTKQYIYKNRKLIIFGFIIAVLLAYITHLENNCNYQPHKQYGGTVTGTEQKPTTSYKLQKGGGGEGSPNDPEKVASVTTSAADETKPKEVKNQTGEVKTPQEVKPVTTSVAAEGGPKSVTTPTDPTKTSQKESTGTPQTEVKNKEGDGGQIDNKGNSDGKGKKDGQGSMSPSGKEGKKGSKGQPGNKAGDKAAKKQGMGFLSGFKNINAKGGIFTKIFGAFKSVYQFFVDRIKDILYIFLTLFLFALLLISPIVFMMVVVYYMVKFLLKRQSTL